LIHFYKRCLTVGCECKMGLLKLNYQSLAELQEKGKFGDTSKYNIKNLCVSSEKVFNKAIETKGKGDEETAYIFFFKYVECVKAIQKHPEYKKDEKYFKSMYNLGKNTKTAINALETLSENLQERYAQKNEGKNKINGLVENSFLDENCNNKKKGVGLAVDETVEEPVKSPEKNDIITVQKLNSLIKEKSTTFFILDTRPAQDYKNSYLVHPSSMNVCESVLTPGITASSISKGLRIEFRDMWERRDQVDLLIICDWLSTDWTDNSAPTHLKNALLNWDYKKKYKNSPVLLEGGFQKFLLAYPHQVSNPRARAPESYRPKAESSEIAPDISSITFPSFDLDSGFIVTPSPSPKNVSGLVSGAITKVKGPEAVKYPDLKDIASSNYVSTPKSSRQDQLKPGINKEIIIPNVNRSTKPPSGLNDRSRESMPEANNTSSLSYRNSVDSGISDGKDSLLDKATFLSDTGSSLPTVDRGLKKDALKKYGMDVESLEDAMKVEEQLADQSLLREQKELELERDWENLRLKREKEAEEEMKKIMAQQMEELESQIENLKISNNEKEESESKLRQELDEYKKKLKETEEKNRNIELTYKRNLRKEEIESAKREEMARLSRIKQKETERIAIELELDKKRKLRRKSREEYRRTKMNQESRDSPLRFDQPGNSGARTKTYLKTDEDAPTSGGLKRSFSSPNIAKMMEKENTGDKTPKGYDNVPVPKFDRKQKPSLITSRNFAGVWGTQKPGLTGLKNLGNTCYMNSILQCFSNSPPLAHYYISGGFEEDLNTRGETGGLVAAEFKEVLKHLWSSQYKSISPVDFKQTVGRFKSEFAGRDQQDSHEFCSKLLEWLHEDTNKVSRPSKEPEQNFKSSADTSAAATHWRNYLERNQSIIVQLFCGQTRSICSCLSCPWESVTYRDFNNLTLPLPESSGRVTLRDCFECYLREEILNDATCDSCKKKGIRKKTEIVKLPPLLIIHLSRFYQDGISTRKKQNFVNFELSNVNLGHYAKQGFDNRWNGFNLYAVSNHFGSLEGGHYTAYANSNVLKKWHKYDDQDVSPLDSADVVTPAAYLLFYSAIEGQDRLPPLS